MNFPDRRRFLNTLLEGLAHSTGVVVLAQTVLPATASEEQEVKKPKTIAQRADQVEAEQGIDEDASEFVRFVNGGFRKGGFVNGGFHNGGFTNGGFRKGGFVNGGFRNGGFRN